MQHRATTRPQFLSTMAIALIATVIVIVLSLNLEPRPFEPTAGVSWAINGGSKVPVANPAIVDPLQLVRPEGVSWAANGGSKTPVAETGSGSDVHELIEGVPWAANGGSKVPAFGFVR